MNGCVSSIIISGRLLCDDYLMDSKCPFANSAKETSDIGRQRMHTFTAREKGQFD